MSVPKDKEYDSAYLELCNIIRHNLINQICEESSEIIDPVIPEEVRRGISQFNSKEAPDKLGLMAEHLKCAGSAIFESVTDLFNQFFLNKKVPEAFKTGILTQY